MKKPEACTGCQGAQSVQDERRRLLRLASGGLLASVLMTGTSQAAPAKNYHVVAGDFLVEEDPETAPAPLKAQDIEVGKPVLAFPLDPATNAPRTESRFNKMLLIRVPEAELTSEAKAISAGGVLAFSSVCTHQGCEVKTFLSKEHVLACYCHGSKFSPTQAGAVVGGPAPRSLPVLPLALRDGLIVVAGEFSSPPGALAGGG